MPATFYQHPRSPVGPLNPPEPLPPDTDLERLASVNRAQKAAIKELQGALHDLAKTPLHVQALKGELAPDTCCACGCHIPLKPVQTSWPMGVLYGDPHLDVTRALAYTLEYECGPAVQVFYDSLGADERLMFARQLSRVAVTTYIEELAK